MTLSFIVCHQCRLRAAGKANADGAKKSRARERVGRGIPVPEANAELQANIDVCLIRIAISLKKIVLACHSSLIKYKYFSCIFHLILGRADLAQW